MAVGYVLRKAVESPATATELAKDQAVHAKGTRHLPRAVTLNTHLPLVMGLITTRASRSGINH